MDGLTQLKAVGQTPPGKLTSQLGQPRYQGFAPQPNSSLKEFEARMAWHCPNPADCQRQGRKQSRDQGLSLPTTPNDFQVAILHISPFHASSQRSIYSFYMFMELYSCHVSGLCG